MLKQGRSLQSNTNIYLVVQGSRGDPGPIGAVGFSGPPVSTLKPFAKYMYSFDNATGDKGGKASLLISFTPHRVLMANLE